MTGIDYFKTATNLETFEAGDVIIEEGVAGDILYAVRSGSVEISQEGHVLDVVGAGEIFGEMSLIDMAPRSAKVTAKEQTVVVPVDRKRFLFLVQETPTFALQVMSTMAKRLRKMHELVS